MTVLHTENERRLHQRAERDRPVSPRQESRHWLSINEACRLLGVDQSTLRRWSDAGKVPVFRTPGGHRRYAEDDLLTLLGEKGRRPTFAPVPGPANGQPQPLEPADGPSQPFRPVANLAPGQLPHRANEVLRHIAELLTGVRTSSLDATVLPRSAAMVRQAGMVLGNVCAGAHHGATEMVSALIALRPRMPYGTPADHIAMAAVRQAEAASQLLDQALLSAIQAHADATMATLGTPYLPSAEIPVLGDA